MWRRPARVRGSYTVTAGGAPVALPLCRCDPRIARSIRLFASRVGPAMVRVRMGVIVTLARNTSPDTDTRARALPFSHTHRVSSLLYSTLTDACLSKSILSKPVPSRAQLSRAVGPAGVQDRWGPPPE